MVCVLSRLNPFRDIANRLDAGVPAARVWSSLEAPESVTVASRIASGLTVTDAVTEINDDGVWGIVRDVWLYSARVGAPLSLIMNRISEAYTHSASALAARDTATIGARATLRILVALPVVGAVVAGISGLDVLGFYVGSPFGALTLGVGGLLLWLGWYRMKVIIRSVTSPLITTGMIADLAAVSVRTGVATSVMIQPLARLAALWSASDEFVAVRQIIDRSHGTGAPLGPTLAAEASRARQHTRLGVNRDIEALPTRLLLPTGVLLLPSFIVLTVVPTVVLMARSALG